MRWNICLTEPGRDATAAIALQQLAYLVYRPIVMRRVTFIEHNRKHVRARPASFFPGYLFVEPGGQGFARLRTAEGVKRSTPLLMRGTEYAVLPEGALEEIRRTEQELFAIGTTFTKGDRVSFKEGPFSGMFATVADVDGDTAVVLLMQMLGCETRVRASVNQLKGAA